MSKPWPDKTIIGLTGNIATGKSAVMKLAAEKGALTIDADAVVHDLLQNDPAVQAAVVAAFGNGVERPDGSINRAALAAIVFSDEAALRKLEGILHPAVRRRIFARVEGSDAPHVMIEAIKLLEGALVEIVDQVWVTRCPRPVQIERLMVCRGMDAETAAVRVNAQSPQEAKVARADVVIDTGGLMSETMEQFQTAWHRLSGTRVQQAKPASAPPSRGPVERPQRPADGFFARGEEITVRRARPSDIAAILLLLRRAANGVLTMGRADLLRAFGERSYLIGQVGSEIGMVCGWNTDSTTAVCVDRIYFHPPEALAEIGPAMLAEIEKSATELLCEVVMFFLPHDGPEAVQTLLNAGGYQRMGRADMRRAWQQTVDELRPDQTFTMAKVLRDVRIA